MLKRTTIKANIPVIYLKEGEVFICYSPAFDLTTHGDSFEDAERSFAQTLKLFVEQVSKKDTWEEVLREYGWEKVKHEWNPPRVIGQESKTIEIPVPACSRSRATCELCASVPKSTSASSSSSERGK